MNYLTQKAFMIIKFLILVFCIQLMMWAVVYWVSMEYDYSRMWSDLFWKPLHTSGMLNAFLRFISYCQTFALLIAYFVWYKVNARRKRDISGLTEKHPRPTTVQNLRDTDTLLKITRLIFAVFFMLWIVCFAAGNSFNLNNFLAVLFAPLNPDAHESDIGLAFDLFQIAGLQTVFLGIGLLIYKAGSAFWRK